MRPLGYARAPACATACTPFSSSIVEPMALADRGGGRGRGVRGGVAAAAGTCACGCPCCSPAWQRSLKRKLEESDGGTRYISCGSVNDEEKGTGAGLTRAAIENETEAAALREVLASREKTIQKLLRELAEERNASSSAAIAAMSMIVRLQQEKAEAEMEARQFERMAEEKMAHDQQELASLEDLLFKRDHAMQALSWEVQAYRHRLLSYGIGIDGDMPPSEPQTPDTATATATATPVDADPQFDPYPSDYPPLRCKYDSSADLDLIPSAETPRGDIDTFQPRVFHLERMRPSSFPICKDKGVVVSQSPRRGPRDLGSFSNASVGSSHKGDGCPRVADRSSECGGMTDRVYTVDAVHEESENLVITPKEVHGRGGGEKGGRAAKEAEIRKLILKLQALEANKESTRQSADKAQMALWKDITQQVCKEAASNKKGVKKQASFKKPSIMSMCKSLVSVVLWKKRSCRVKYTFGLSSSTSGLMLLLDNSPRLRTRRLLTKAQG